MEGSGRRHGIETLQQSAGDTGGPEGATEQSGERPHILGMKTIVTDQREQQTPAQIGTYIRTRRTSTTS